MLVTKNRAAACVFPAFGVCLEIPRLRIFMPPGRTLLGDDLLIFG
jgi:hypothetical protein